MKIENEFMVAQPPDRAFETLFDVPLVASCVPGAELLDGIAPPVFRGRISVKLVPVAMRFGGTVTVVQRDPATRTGRLQAKGDDDKGRGSAHATTLFRIEAVPSGSRVLLTTELTLSGLAAQYGRASGVVRVLANEVVNAFATNLRRRLEAGPDQAAAAQPQALSAIGLVGAAAKRWWSGTDNVSARVSEDR